MVFLAFEVGAFAVAAFLRFGVAGVGGLVARFEGFGLFFGVCAGRLLTLLFFTVFLVGVGAGVLCCGGEDFWRLPFDKDVRSSSSVSSADSAPAKSSEESEDSGSGSPRRGATSITFPL